MSDCRRLRGRASSLAPSPARRSKHRQGCRKSKKGRTETAVNAGQPHFIQVDPHRAQHALNDHRQQGRDRAGLHPTPIVPPPNGDHQPNRQDANRSPPETMPMLDEQVPRPLQPTLPGIHVQVIAVRREAVGHGHAGLIRRHQSADPNQWKRGAHQQHRQAMRPRTCRLAGHGRHGGNLTAVMKFCVALIRARMAPSADPTVGWHCWLVQQCPPALPVQ